MITNLAFAEPFFTVTYFDQEPAHQAKKRCILINLASEPIGIQSQLLHQFQSVIVTNTPLRNLQSAVIVEGFDDYQDEATFLNSIKQNWQLAYDVRKEERLKGVSHYMSPKDKVKNVQFSMYHSASVPLNVGLHKTHTHCGDSEPREIHTQLVGLGKMQQCLEKDTSTLYVEEIMAPGTTHKPMFDENVNYPWHQYETITPSVFMAIEITA